MSITVHHPKGFTPEDQARLMVDLAKAAKGDAAALAVAQRTLHDYPEVWEGVGDLAQVAESTWIRAVAGPKDLVLAEGLRHKAAAMRAELAGPASTPLEALLVERIVACWLQVQAADAVYAQHMGSLTLAQGEYYQRRAERAQRKYLAAIKALASVRRLLTPAMQVNIATNGGQQVNVAGTVTALTPPPN